MDIRERFSTCPHAYPFNILFSIQQREEAAYLSKLPGSVRPWLAMT
jgi:hypothetical protein